MIGHEVQRSSDATANESEENTTKVNTAKEKAIATKIAVDNEPENETSVFRGTGSSNGKSELPALFSDSVSSNKEGNHQLTAKEGETRKGIKSKVVGVVESDEQSEKENMTSLEEKRKRLLHCPIPLYNKNNIQCYSVHWQFPKRKCFSRAFKI